MIPYIVLMIFNFILNSILKVNRSKQGQKIYIFLMGVMLVAVSGFRTIDIGVDTSQFCINFVRISNCTSLSDAIAITRYESGFVLFCYFLSRISNDYQILIFCSSLIITISVLDFIKKNSRDIAFSIYFYITMSFFGMYMNIMRQALAIAIFLWAYDYFYKEKKYLKFFIGVVLASTFHSTALVLLALPLISLIKFKTKPMLLTVGASILLFVFERQIVTQIAILSGYSGYLTKGNYFGSNYFGALLLFLVNLMFFIFCYLHKNSFDIQEQDLLKVSFVSLVLTLCTMQISIVGRIAEFFNVFNILLVPNILRGTNSIDNKRLLRFCIVIFLFIYWAVIGIYRPEWYGVIPYKSIFF